MSKNLSDISASDNEGDVSVAGRDVNSIVIGDTTVGEVLNTVTAINIPPDNTDEKLEQSLENNRALLRKSKRNLAKLVLSGSKSHKEIVAAIINIKKSGVNIVNIIDTLSVRGVKCEYLASETSYEYEIVEILEIKEKINKSVFSSVCPHCESEILIKNKISKNELVVSLLKPNKIMNIFESCGKHESLNGFKISRCSSIYCKACKNKVCVYYSVLTESYDNYIDEKYPI